MNSTYFETLFEIGNSKINTKVKMSAVDKKAGMKIYCMEPYAQEMYNTLSGAGAFTSKISKDLEMDEIYSVKLKSFDSAERLVYAQELNSTATVFIPVRELVNFQEDEIRAMISQEAKIKVIVFRKEDGEIYGSEKRCIALTYRQDMDELYKTNQVFNVKILSLIDGGYIALYRNSIKCFLPGSQAAANVIYDFSEYLGKELPVMIENFDSSNNLYIVSYKKYIKHTLINRIHELNFGKKYTGTLTAKPYNFGIFVEWQNYYTGLIHFTEFGNEQQYQELSKNYKTGDSIDFYIKDITSKKGEPRIILTLDPNSVNRDKKAWQKLKDQAEGQSLDFVFDKADQVLEIILPDDTVTNISIDVNKYRNLINKSTKIRIDRIDVIRQNVKFEFE